MSPEMSHKSAVTTGNSPPILWLRHTQMGHVQVYSLFQPVVRVTSIIDDTTPGQVPQQGL